MNKIVFVINGRGGVGKDLVCDIVTQNIGAMNISSITPVKEAAKRIGWDGEKDLRGRRLLAQLKEALTQYDDRPLRYALERFREFMSSPVPVMFVHIREPKEIERFRLSVEGCPCRTLLVRRPSTGNAAFGNPADDGVEDYSYDYTYVNDKPLNALEDDVLSFFIALLAEEGVEFFI